MKFLLKHVYVIMIITLIGGGIFPSNGLSLTVKEEEDLSRQVLHNIYAQFEFIDDPVIVAYVNRIGQQVASHFPKQLFPYRFYVIDVDVYNAFAIPGGHIFIYSGLLAAMESEEELAGILGHEIAHVYCRHISQSIERAKKLQMASLAGIAAGVLLGMTGSGEAGSAVTQGSMAATQSAMLAYTRENEIQADQLGLKYIDAAGYRGDGLLAILKKMRGKTWFSSDQIPTYLMTHPAIDDRIAYIDSWLDGISKTNKPKPMVDSEAFDRVHLKIITRYSDEKTVLEDSKAAVSERPDDPMAHYQYGLILARIGRRDEAIRHIKIALEKRAFDPYILNDLGRIYFLQGQYQKALSILQSVQTMIPDDAECLLYLGQTQAELNQLDKAADSFHALVRKHPRFKQGYYFLGQTLGKKGNLGDAHYYLGIYYLKDRDYNNARSQFTRALKYTTDIERKQEIEKVLKKLNPKKQKKNG
jgi:predicted Zn-dependent protease